jgi:hypothetical protein
MMIKKSALVALVVAISLVFAVPAFAGGPPPRTPDGDRVRPVIYVTSQGLYYDSIVGPSLPMKGRFQKLEVVGEQLVTEFGPGDHDFVGGRWWMDANGDNIMNEGDAFFSCPLLGPGRAAP